MPAKGQRGSDVESRPRYEPLDGIRAVALLGIFAFHVRQGWDPGAYMGLDMFFAMSGYLITMLLLREYRRDGDVWLRGFYMRRVLRLMPALTIFVIVTVPVAIADGMSKPLSDGVAAITYVMDFYAPRTFDHGGVFGHTWSLAVEEQFYLIWPAILIWGLRRKIRLERLIAGAMIVFMAVSLPLSYRYGMSAVYRTPFPHVPDLAAGVLLALLFDGPAKRVGALKKGLAHPVVGWGSTGLLVLGIMTATGDRRWLFAGGFLAIGVVSTVMLGHTLVAPRGAVARMFSIRPAVWLGRRSYAFYLWHYPVVVMLAARTGSGLLVVAIGLPVTTALTMISWSLVEQPFLRLKERFEPERPVLVSPDPATA